MPRWWDKVLGRADRPAGPSPQNQEPATWLAADDPGNPFGVPVLDLMRLQGIVATSTDPTCAVRAMSWRGSLGKELVADALLALPPLEGALRYPAARSLPDGILFAPPSMDWKWVLALREGRLLAARSWTGAVEAVADARRDGDELVLERVRVAEASALRIGGRLLEVLDWLLRVHIWDQKLPLPVDDVAAEELERAPLSGFARFGKALFCAARRWSVPPPPRPLRADGAVILAARQGDPAALARALAEGADVDAPATCAGATALHVAAMKGDLALLDELLRLGADPAARADGGVHALHYAVVHRAPLALLDRIAATRLDLAVSSADGFTALHSAAQVDHAAIVPWLLAHGLPLEGRTARGYTALHIACALGSAQAARALLAAGADRTAPSGTGTPREVAVAEKRPEVVALLDAWR